MSVCKISTIAVFVTALTAAFVTAPGVASAADCTTGRNLRSYNTGVLIGGSIVDQAWHGVDQNPDEFDQFKDVVKHAVATAIAGMAGSVDDFVRCRAKGLGQGVIDRLDAIQGQVVTACLLDGDMWGEFSADLYCVLSNAFGGLEGVGLLPNPPDKLCGERFEASCHDAFGAYATTPANNCAEYSTGSVFTETQQNMCIYLIP